MNRDRIDEVRKLLLDAFMAEDEKAYAQCVSELEDLIGVPHGDRNPKGHTPSNPAAQTALMRKARSKHFAFGNRKVDAEIHSDGIMTYSIRYGSS